ncbi:sensor histidine kinase [Terribacillus saccharophilus]|uniref:histidine kinase n=1 Tax=Terribacillus saccharophilus TaxID=361277 RepID=A0ABX4H148_9BACI|nr:sensor histidine kinase [Terribacillus saccharophilus]PAD36443.1 sensor histidine kinase [Terribacillus saccharophilus]PAD97107.1 sensor histidine kinase [Terribacillus saccharophilus]PAE00855.1 sensor histidine kinase [Terribacillus saccharophilus]
MLKKLNSIRYSYIKTNLRTLFLNAILLLGILLSIYVLLEPMWLSVQAIFTFFLLYLLLHFITSVVIGFQDSKEIKDRMDYMSLFITMVANGNYQAKIVDNSNDEIARIGKDLNELTDKMHTQVKSLQRLADEKAELAEGAHRAAAIEERQRLARDLHDAVSQQLFALTMMSKAGMKLFDKNSEAAKDKFTEVSQIAQQAQTEMRALLLHLRPVHLSGDSLSSGVRKLVDELKQRTQLIFHIQIEETMELSKSVEEHLFRIIQEALSNTLRHAEASEVTVELLTRGMDVAVTIQDNGKGFDTTAMQQRKTSFGLKSMQERCEELGGTFMLRASVGVGTQIGLRIPTK